MGSEASRAVRAAGGTAGLYIPARMTARAKIAASTMLALACAAILGACGSQGIQVSKSSPHYRGAVLFRERCSGCHTLAVVGAEGSATNIKNRVRTNGPNFNIRLENVEQVLYAIRNGGFSGAIMPQNIVLGDDAQAVASFLAQYSGRQAQKVPAVNITLSTK
jgi:mono/diheme cytochrome c family protein